MTYFIEYVMKRSGTLDDPKFRLYEPNFRSHDPKFGPYLLIRLRMNRISDICSSMESVINLFRSMSMEDRQPAAAVRGLRAPLHGEPPVDETFKCLCERCKVSAQDHGALFNCRWNQNALGKDRCGLFSFLRASVFVRTTAVEHVSFVLSLTSLTSLTSP